MTTRRAILRVPAMLLIAAIATGCADLFLGLGDAFTAVGTGLNTIGKCFSPLEPIDLNGVLTVAPSMTWSDDTATLTDDVQPDVQTLLADELGDAVRPLNYQALRFWQLGAFAAGEAIEIDSIGDRVDHLYLYDANMTLLPLGAAHDFDGFRRTLRVVIPAANDRLYLRADLGFLSNTGEPMLTLRRQADQSPPAPQSQTAVLHFSGADLITYRNGYIIPTHVDAITDPAVQLAAFARFMEVFAAYDLTVLTDADPPPAEPYSVIYIGAIDPPFDYYGLAEIVDAGNEYHDDIAIVDAGQTFLEAARLLGPDTHGRALGLIAAHEMGHLLGLYHVTDPDALMTGSQCQGTDVNINRMLQRNLKTAPLTLVAADLKEWVVGIQNPHDYLLHTLGPKP
jgi:hypothetical protein